MSETAVTDTLRKYCPHEPFPKQQTFLDLTCKEAFYGGGAGPGKTDALLMAALQYVHVPGYSALLLRRDFPRLSLPSSIMARAKEWLLHKSDAHWVGQDKTFTFPSGAVLQFGYIDNPDDRFRYASSEYQFIGWDELTEFRLSESEHNPYQFMFSRLRKTRDIPVPLRMRSASNPGNLGHMYVKNRFVTEEAIEALLDDKPRVFYSDEAKECAFVPALLKDNPFIDYDDYVSNLMHLPAVTRARLLKGDWSVIEDALIPVDWLRDYEMQGEMLRPIDKHGKILGAWDARRATRFITVDTAGTEKQLEEQKKRDRHSWSVAGVWDQITVNGRPWLFLRHVWRDKVGFTNLLDAIRKVKQDWKPSMVYIEHAHFGPAVFDVLKREMNVKTLKTGTRNKTGEGGTPGKVERASELLLMLEHGQIFLPKSNNHWRPDLEAEWLSWTGDKDETNDQIDMASYAAIVAGVKRSGWGGVVGNRTAIGQVLAN